MAAKPSYQVYMSPEEKQKVLEESAQAGFTSISDYFRSLAGLPTRKEQREYAQQHAAREYKRQEIGKILRKRKQPEKINQP